MSAAQTCLSRTANRLVGCFLSLLPVACRVGGDPMSDPGAWTALGPAIRAARGRQGLTREDPARRVRERGQQVTARSIGTLEEGPPPKRGAKRPTLEPTVAALGWQPGWTDRILAGEDPAAVVLSGPPVEPAASPRGELLELGPHVQRFTPPAARLA